MALAHGVRYALAPTLLGLALLLSLGVHPFLPGLVSYLFLAAVVAAAWLGGWGPALLAALLAPLLYDYFFLPPLHTLGISPEARPWILPFLLSALAAAWVSASRAATRSAQQRSEAKFRRILSNQPDISWTADERGRMTYISPKVEKTLGYSNQEIYAGGTRLLLDRVHPADLRRLQAAMDQLFRRRADFDVEFRFRRRDNAWIWLHSRAVSYRIDGTTFADGVLSDVSGRKGAEMELRAKTAFLEAQTNASIDGVLVINADGRRILQNQRFNEMFSLPRELIEGADDAPVLDHIIGHARDPAAFGGRMLQLYGHPGEVSREEVELTNGRIMDLYSSPVTGTGGRFYGRIWAFRDITEMRRSERELRSKTAFLEAQRNATIDGVLVVNADGRRVFENGRFDEMFSVPQELLEALDDAPVLKHVVSQTRNPEPFLNRVLHLYTHPEETSRDEIELLNGRILDRYSSPVRGADGVYYGRIWTFRDITEMRRGERELQSKTAFLEAQANSTIDGLLVVDDQGRRILHNTRVVEMFCIPAEAMADPDQRHARRYILEAVREPEQSAALIARMYEHPEETSRYEVELKNGGTLDIYSAPVRGRKGEYYGRVWTFRDITERKRREDALRQLSAAVEQSPVSVVITDPDGSISYVNRKFSESTGYSAEEELGKNPRLLNSGYSPREMYGNLWATIRAGREWRGEFRNRKKNGDLFWEAATISPITDASGAISHFVAVKEDITERLNLEGELRQAQKLEAIGQLAAGIAHEINTPIQFVSDNLAFLDDATSCAYRLLDLYRAAVREEAPPVAARMAQAEAECDQDFLREETPRAIEQSLEGIRRVATIVRAMKEFSHPDLAEKRYVDLNQGIESTITIARSEWKHAAEMATELDAALPPVLCHPGDVNQVILNLIVNAAHAIRERPDRQRGQITVRTARRNGFAEIAVSDTGVGIPTEIQGRVFEPFFTTREVGSGTGQGLALAHSVIVRKHQGKIWFETEVGRGTTFFVHLPIEPFHAKEAK